MRVRLSGQVKNRAEYVPTGRLWPSGDFSLGYRRIEPDSRVDYSRHLSRLDRGEMTVPGSPAWSQGRWGFPSCNDAAIDYQGHQEGLSVAIECAQHERLAGECWADPLDLTTPRNSHNGVSRREKYGKKGITALGRKMVKSAATLIQKMPNKRITFCTITMPTLPQHLRRDLALVWPEFLRQLIQWLSRRLRATGLPPLVCSVTEIQRGRLQENLEGYLHLHLVWPNHFAKSGNWSVDVSRLKTWCSEFLISRNIWVQTAWVNVDTQQVEKTAAGYLAKYMSKGSDELESFAEDCGWDAIPAQWWNLSKPARDLVMKFTHQGDAVGALLDSVINFSLSEQELHQYHVLLPAVLTWEGGERIAGWYGVVVAGFRRELVSMLRSGGPA